MAREDVGALVARLVADTDGLKADMEKAARQVKSATGKMNRSLAKTERNTRNISKSFNFMKVAALAASAIMAGRFIKSQLDAAATILDTSNKIGLQVESLQELRFAGAQFGITQRQTDLAMQRFSRRVGEAIRGQGELKDTLLQYNIALVKTDGTTRSVENILLDYADAVAGAGSQQEKLRLAFKAFDSEGAAFVNVMQQGSAGIGELAARAQSLGIILDREMVEKAKAASDRFTELGFVLKQQVLVAVTDNAEAFETFGETAILAIDGIVNSVGFLLTKLNQTGLLLSALVSGDLDIAITRAQKLFGATTGGTVGGVLPPSTGGTTSSTGETTTPAGIAGFLQGEGGGGAAQEELGVTIEAEAITIIESLKKVRDISRDTEQEIFEHFVSMAEKRADVARQLADDRIMMEQLVANSAVGFLQAIGREHKGAAIAALAIQKVLAVKEIFIQTEVAAQRALAELGPIAGPPVAAAIRAKGKISAALVAATGLVEASQISSGGGGLGTLQNPLVTRPAATTASASSAIAGVQGKATVQLIFQGDVNGWDAFVEQKVIGAISDAINERDVVLIRNDSRQTQEIVRASS